MDSSEDVPVEQLAERMDDFEFVARVGVDYAKNAQTSFFGEIAQEAACRNDQVMQMYGEILPVDFFFKAASIRQIGHYITEIISGNNDAIVTNLIQSINEPLGHYYDWGFIDLVSDGIFDLFYKMVTKGYEASEFYQKIGNIQSFGFLKTFTSQHTVLFKTNKILANFVKM